MLFVAFSIFLSLIFVKLNTMCLSISLLGSLCFLDLDDCFLSHVGEVFSYCLLKMFSHVLFLSCPSGTPIM